MNTNENSPTDKIVDQTDVLDVMRCPKCGSSAVGHLRFDSDWAYGGDWTKINPDDYYMEYEIRQFEINERPDIECNICCRCGQCF